VKPCADATGDDPFGYPFSSLGVDFKPPKLS
jgi:hypothetical protein